jgi:hypothetical protein
MALSLWIEKALDLILSHGDLLGRWWCLGIAIFSQHQATKRIRYFLKTGSEKA